MTQPLYKGRKKTGRHRGPDEYPFYPTHLIRGLMAILGAVFAVALTSALLPLPLDHIADPLAGPGAESGILWLLKPVAVLFRITSRPGLTVGLVTFLAVLFIILPVVDRSGKSSIRRRIMVAVPFLLWLLFLAWTILFTGGAV